MSLIISSPVSGGEGVPPGCDAAQSPEGLPPRAVFTEDGGRAVSCQVSGERGFLSCPSRPASYLTPCTHPSWADAWGSREPYRGARIDSPGERRWYDVCSCMWGTHALHFSRVRSPVATHAV